jgi:Ni/Co efflux regulator RcnB
MKRLLFPLAVIALTTPQIVMAQTQDRAQTRATKQVARPQGHQTTRQQRTTVTHTRVTKVTRPARVATTRVSSVTRTTRVNRVAVARPTAQARVQRRAGYHPAQVQRVRATTFRYPSGYSYRRWTTGGILPRTFLSSNYYYNDWYGLGFGPPPRGYAWVRYGPDLLLVNIRTGRVADVVYGVFY